MVMGAFGGSISLATATPNHQPTVEVSGSFGTYNTYNAGVNFSTGLLGNHFIFDGAYHGNSHRMDISMVRPGRSGSYYGGLTYVSDNFQIRYKKHR